MSLFPAPSEANSLGYYAIFTICNQANWVFPTCPNKRRRPILAAFLLERAFQRMSLPGMFRTRCTRVQLTGRTFSNPPTTFQKNVKRHSRVLFILTQNNRLNSNCYAMTTLQTSGVRVKCAASFLQEEMKVSLVFFFNWGLRGGRRGYS